MATSLDTAQAQLDAYLAAEVAALANKSYTIAGRTLTRQDLGDIQKGIQYWTARVSELSAQARGRGRSATMAR